MYYRWDRCLLYFMTTSCNSPLIDTMTPSTMALWLPSYTTLSAWSKMHHQNIYHSNGITLKKYHSQIAYKWEIHGTPFDNRKCGIAVLGDLVMCISWLGGLKDWVFLAAPIVAHEDGRRVYEYPTRQIMAQVSFPLQIGVFQRCSLQCEVICQFTQDALYVMPFSN